MTTPSDDLFDVAGKVVVVTGGLGQLGRQFTRTLVTRGARVVVVDALPAKQAPAELFGDAASDENVLVLQTEVTSRGSIQAALDATEDRWGTPHGLINSAAIDTHPDAPAAENGPFETYPEDAWDHGMSVNTKGVFLCCQVFGGAMAAVGRGSVVQIGSTYGLVSPDQRIYAYREEEGAPFFKPVTYAASKSTLLNLTRYLATYWAPRGVRVNTLTLGGVYCGQDARFVEGYEARVPLGRMARVDEYNGAIVFLMSGASAYMTGANLVIDGGWTAW
jgi:NAD(P)-dependent dehydrogenase (short-subunit alcohol dehydrogenase family)